MTTLKFLNNQQNRRTSTDKPTPAGLSYAIAFTVTMHVRKRNVRLPAFQLSFEAAGSCLKLAQSANSRQRSNGGRYWGYSGHAKHVEVTPALDPKPRKLIGRMGV
jgi:hypothetical protein